MNKPSKKAETLQAEIDTLVEQKRYIMERSEAIAALQSLGNKPVALDFETTGLMPPFGRVRLTNIYHPDHGVILIDHLFAGSFEDLIRYYKNPFWVVYNAKFEANWFNEAFNNHMPDDYALIDVDFLAKSKLGGYPSSLARMVRRDLGVFLDKEEQNSDWSQERLTASQLNYAALDAIYTWKLYEYWVGEITNEQREAAFIFQDAVLPTVECEQTGMVLDVDLHMDNINKWKMKQAIALRRVRKWTNETLLPNPGSDKQVSDLIKGQLDDTSFAAWPKTEKSQKKAKAEQQLALSRKIVQPLAAKSEYPFSRWLNALLRFRYYRKYLSTYGETLVTKQYLEDAITYRLNIGQAGTGRYSSSSINIQNIPRAVWVRRAFLPPHGFKYFVVADYSGIEVRVLAELSGDKVLLQDAIYGDVHAGAASAIFSIDLDEFLAIINEPDPEETGIQHTPQYYRYKEMRSRSKPFTFQNIYGAAAPALSIALKCSISEAEDALRKWAERYPKAYNYRYQIFDHMMQDGFLPVVDGRTIYVMKPDRSLPVAANYGVQGAAASVMYRAMYHVWKLRNERVNRHLVRLCATVHDELLLAVAGDEWVDEAKDILTTGMIRGWLDIFPGTDTMNLVEAKHGLNWGDAK